MKQGDVTTDDGVRLHFQVFGEGPPMLFANGIGVRYPGALRQIAALRHDFTIICWDYRGIGRSRLADSSRADLSMPRHARDALTVLDHLEIPRAVFVGWSMGVQVNFEVFRLAPERMAGFVALLGTYGRPFKTAFSRPVAFAFEGAFGVVGRIPRLTQATLEIAVALPRVAFKVLNNVLFVGPDADREVFAVNVQSVADADRTAYNRTLMELSSHDASDLMPTMDMPALIICGEDDHLTPPKVARRMADTMPDAVYREVNGGTHFALIERPELINAWLIELGHRAFRDSDLLRPPGMSVVT